MNFLKKMGLRIALLMKPVETEQQLISAVLHGVFDKPEAEKWLRHLEAKRKEHYGVR